jgi:hypothetical protein
MVPRPLHSPTLGTPSFFPAPCLSSRKPVEILFPGVNPAYDRGIRIMTQIRQSIPVRAPRSFGLAHWGGVAAFSYTGSGEGYGPERHGVASAAPDAPGGVQHAPQL